MKIVATDFDGTLCMPNQPIPQENIDAIRKWQAAGNKFGIVSARNLDLLLGILGEYSDVMKPDYLVCNNGCTVFGADGQKLYADTIPTDLYHEIMNHQSVLQSSYVYIETIGHTYVFERYPGAGKELAVSLPPLPIVTEKEALQLQDVVMLSIICKDLAAIQKCSEAVSRDTAGRLSGFYNQRYIDISMGGNDKATGIRHAAEAQDWQDATIFTVGDDLNDLAMIAAFEGCALPWSKPAVHAAAKHEYSSVADLMLNNM